MGLLETISKPFVQQISKRGAVVEVVCVCCLFCLLIVLVNVLKQLLFRNSHEPPVVFHWFPVIGNAITYGINPYKFFSDCKAKVSLGDSTCSVKNN